MDNHFNNDETRRYRCRVRNRRCLRQFTPEHFDDDREQPQKQPNAAAAAAR